MFVIFHTNLKSWKLQNTDIGQLSDFFIIKPTRFTNFTNIFWHENLHVSDSFRAGPGWNCSSILVLLESCLQTCMTYTIAECTVNKLLMMDRGTVRNR